MIQMVETKLTGAIWFKHHRGDSGIHDMRDFPEILWDHFWNVYESFCIMCGIKANRGGFYDLLKNWNILK